MPRHGDVTGRKETTSGISALLGSKQALKELRDWQRRAQSALGWRTEGVWKVGGRVGDGELSVESKHETKLVLSAGAEDGKGAEDETEELEELDVPPMPTVASDVTLFEAAVVRVAIGLLSQLWQDGSHLARDDALRLLCSLGQLFGGDIDSEQVSRLRSNLQTQPKAGAQHVRAVIAVLFHPVLPIVPSLLAHLEAVFLHSASENRGAAVAAATALATRLHRELERDGMQESRKAVIQPVLHSVTWSTFVALNNLSASTCHTSLLRLALIEATRDLMPQILARDSDLAQEVVAALLSLPRKSTFEQRAVIGSLSSTYCNINNLKGHRPQLRHLPLRAFEQAMSSELDWNSDLLAGAVAAYLKHVVHSSETDVYVVQETFAHANSQDIAKEQEFEDDPSKPILKFVDDMLEYQQSPATPARLAVAAMVRGVVVSYGSNIHKLSPHVGASIIMGCIDPAASVRVASLACMGLLAQCQSDDLLAGQIEDFANVFMHPYLANSVPVLPLYMRTAALSWPPPPLLFLTTLCAKLEHTTSAERRRHLALLEIWAGRMRQLNFAFVEPLLNILAPLSPKNDVLRSQAEVAQDREMVARVLQQFAPLLSKDQFADAAAAATAYLARALTVIETTLPSHLTCVLLNTLSFVLQRVPSNRFLVDLLNLSLQDNPQIRLAAYNLCGTCEGLWRTPEEQHQCAALLLLGLSDIDHGARLAAVHGITRLSRACNCTEFHDLLQRLHDDLAAHTIDKQPIALHFVVDRLCGTSASAFETGAKDTILATAFRRHMFRAMNRDAPVFVPTLPALLYCRTGAWAATDLTSFDPLASLEQFFGHSNLDLVKTATLTCVLCCLKQNVLISALCSKLLHRTVSVVLGPTRSSAATSSLVHAGYLLLLTYMTVLRVRGVNAYLVDTLLPQLVSTLSSVHATPRLKQMAMLAIHTLLLLRPKHVAAAQLEPIRDSTRALLSSDSASVWSVAARVYPRLFRVAELAGDLVVEEQVSYLAADSNPKLLSAWERAADPMLAHLTPSQLHRLCIESVRALGAFRGANGALKAVEHLLLILRSNDGETRAAAAIGIRSLIGRLAKADAQLCKWIMLPLSQDTSPTVRLALSATPPVAARLNSQDKSLKTDSDDKPTATRARSIPDLANQEIYTDIRDISFGYSCLFDSDASEVDPQDAGSAVFTLESVADLRKQALALGPLDHSKLDIAQMNLLCLLDVSDVKGAVCVALGLLVAHSLTEDRDERVTTLSRRVLGYASEPRTPASQASILGAVTACKIMARVAPQVVLGETLQHLLNSSKVMEGELLAVAQSIEAITDEELSIEAHLSDDSVSQLVEKLVHVLSSADDPGQPWIKALATRVLGDVIGVVQSSHVNRVVESILALLESTEDQFVRQVAGKQLANIATALPSDNAMLGAIARTVQEAIPSQDASRRQHGFMLLSVFHESIDSLEVKSMLGRLLMDPVPELRARVLAWMLDPIQTHSFASDVKDLAEDILSRSAVPDVRTASSFPSDIGDVVKASTRPDDALTREHGADLDIAPETTGLRLPLSDNDPFNYSYIAGAQYRENAAALGLPVRVATVVKHVDVLEALLIPSNGGTTGTISAGKGGMNESASGNEELALQVMQATDMDLSEVCAKIFAGDPAYASRLLADFDGALEAAKSAVLSDEATLAADATTLSQVRYNIETIAHVVAALDGNVMDLAPRCANLRDLVQTTLQRTSALRTRGFDVAESIMLMTWNSLQLPVTSFEQFERAQASLDEIDECAANPDKRVAREEEHSLLVAELYDLQVGLWHLTSFAATVMGLCSRLVSSQPSLLEEAKLSFVLFFSLTVQSSHQDVRRKAVNELLSLSRSRSEDLKQLQLDTARNCVLRLAREAVPDHADAVVRALVAHAGKEVPTPAAAEVDHLAALSGKLYGAKVDVITLLGNLMVGLEHAPLRNAALLQIITAWDDTDSNVARTAMRICQTLLDAQLPELLAVCEPPSAKRAGGSKSHKRRDVARSPLVSAMTRRVKNKRFGERDSLNALLVAVLSAQDDIELEDARHGSPSRT